MSQQMVGIVIDRLVNDESLRLRFVFDRVETLVDLSLLGIELTPDEVSMFFQTDPRVWFCESEGLVGERMH